MKKNLIVALCACASVVASAEMKKLTDEDRKLIKADYKTLTPEQMEKRKAAVALYDLIEDGGIMPFPGTPKGTIRYVNLQQRVKSDDLKPALASFGSQLAYDIAVVDQDCEASLKIKIVDLPDAPVVLVAPEDHWAQINVAKLDDGKVKPLKLAARVRKHMIRSFAFLVGGSQYGMPLFGALRSMKQLDGFEEAGIPIDIIMRAQKYLKTIGIVPEQLSSYREILDNGYNLAPTNDYQKAIYEEVSKRGPLTKKLP